jgi:hypothetical protein
VTQGELPVALVALPQYCHVPGVWNVSVTYKFRKFPAGCPLTGEPDPACTDHEFTWQTPLLAVAAADPVAGCPATCSHTQLSFPLALSRLNEGEAGFPEDGATYSKWQLFVRLVRLVCPVP